MGVRAKKLVAYAGLTGETVTVRADHRRQPSGRRVRAGGVRGHLLARWYVGVDRAARYNPASRTSYERLRVAGTRRAAARKRPHRAWALGTAPALRPGPQNQHQHAPCPALEVGYVDRLSAGRGQE